MTKYLHHYILYKKSLLPNRKNNKIRKRSESREAIHFDFSLTHALCSLKAYLIPEALACAFKADRGTVKEIGFQFVFRFLLFHRRDSNPPLREPVARAVSSYYYWGELNQVARNRENEDKNRFDQKRIGYLLGQTALAAAEIGEVVRDPIETRETEDRESSGMADVFRNRLLSAAVAERAGDRNIYREGENDHDPPKFNIPDTRFSGKSGFLYHGDRSSPPPPDVAILYSVNLPYRRGMPGPSYSWSGFANSPNDAVQVLQSGRVLAMVTERMDESLVVAAHFLNWSLADVVFTNRRKHLSSHPRPESWPPNAIRTLNRTLLDRGEHLVYEVANHMLDDRIRGLEEQGVHFEAELALLRDLRTRVTEVGGGSSHVSSEYN